MKKTKIVAATVVVTLLVEVLLVFIFVVWNYGGDFGSVIRKADYLNRVSRLYDVGILADYNCKDTIENSKSEAPPEWKPEYTYWKR